MNSTVLTPIHLDETNMWSTVQYCNKRLLFMVQNTVSCEVTKTVN